jgi:hypothetical protein
MCLTLASPGITGVNTVSSGRTVVWPNGKKSLCGDRADANPKKNMAERPVQVLQGF